MPIEYAFQLYKAGDRWTIASAVSHADQYAGETADSTLDAMGIRPGMTIGEIGAGDGRITLALARRVGDRGKVYANDIDSKSLAQARRDVRAPRREERRDDHRQGGRPDVPEGRPGPGHHRHRLSPPRAAGGAASEPGVVAETGRHARDRRSGLRQDRRQGLGPADHARAGRGRGGRGGLRTGGGQRLAAARQHLHPAPEGRRAGAGREGDQRAVGSTGFRVRAGGGAGGGGHLVEGARWGRRGVAREGPGAGRRGVGSCTRACCNS